jgi:hypothetical protein
MHGKSVAVAAGVLAAVVLLAACGGGSGSTADNGISKAAYIKEASTICSKAGRKRHLAMEVTEERLAAQGTTSIPLERKELVMKALVPVNRWLVDELLKLEPPSADVAKIEGMLRGFEQGIRKVVGNPSLAFEGTTILTPANVTAEKYGLPECWV